MKWLWLSLSFFHSHVNGGMKDTCNLGSIKAGSLKNHSVGLIQQPAGAFIRPPVGLSRPEKATPALEPTLRIPRPRCRSLRWTTDLMEALNSSQPWHSSGQRHGRPNPLQPRTWQLRNSHACPHLIQTWCVPKKLWFICVFNEVGHAALGQRNTQITL